MIDWKREPRAGPRGAPQSGLYCALKAIRGGDGAAFIIDHGDYFPSFPKMAKYPHASHVKITVKDFSG
jgi:hypothetical protein